jgi:hypothetical protein
MSDEPQIPSIGEPEAHHPIVTPANVTVAKLYRVFGDGSTRSAT